MPTASRRTSQLSRQVSWLLRHGAVEAGLAMDAAGWARVGDVLAALRISREDLVEVVATNDKRRLQLDGDRVRACQGHSWGAGTSRMPVTREALEASWRRVEPDGPLWHGTNLTALDSIASAGLMPGRRTHVHLAATPDAKVGKRANVELLLEVDPARLAGHGLDVFEAPNGVLLVRRVPADCITGASAPGGLPVPAGVLTAFGLAPEPA
jgi:putative RNA 2'-phosphotransferase